MHIYSLKKSVLSVFSRKASLGEGGGAESTSPSKIIYFQSFFGDKSGSVQYSIVDIKNYKEIL